MNNRRRRERVDTNRFWTLKSTSEMRAETFPEEVVMADVVVEVVVTVEIDPIAAKEALREGNGVKEAIVRTVLREAKGVALEALALTDPLVIADRTADVPLKNRRPPKLTIGTTFLHWRPHKESQSFDIKTSIKTFIKIIYNFRQNNRTTNDNNK